MILLTFLACLATKPNYCTTVELYPTNEAGVPMTFPQCTSSLAPQAAIAEWLSSHPAFRASGGWKCQELKARKDPA